MTATARSTAAIRIDDRPAFFIAHPDIIYHAEGTKEKVIYDGRPQVLVEWEAQNQPEIKLNGMILLQAFTAGAKSSVTTEISAPCRWFGRLPAS